MGCNTRNVKVAGEAGVDMIIDLLNQIRALGVILAEWELATIVNCYKGKGDSSETGNHKGLRLTDQILHIAEKRTIPGEIFSTKKNLCFAFVDLEKALDRVPRDAE